MHHLNRLVLSVNSIRCLLSNTQREINLPMHVKQECINGFLLYSKAFSWEIFTRILICRNNIHCILISCKTAILLPFVDESVDYKDYLFTKLYLLFSNVANRMSRLVQCFVNRNDNKDERDNKQNIQGQLHCFSLRIRNNKLLYKIY
jgi:hypothetical protein